MFVDELLASFFAAEFTFQNAWRGRLQEGHMGFHPVDAGSNPVRVNLRLNHSFWVAEFVSKK